MSSECCLLKRRSYAFLVSNIPAFAGKARSIGVYYFAKWLRRYVLTSKHQSLSGISFTQRPIDPLQPHTDCQRAQEYYTIEANDCEVFIALTGDAPFIPRDKPVGFQGRISINIFCEISLFDELFSVGC